MLNGVSPIKATFGSACASISTSTQSGRSWITALEQRRTSISRRVSRSARYLWMAAMELRSRWFTLGLHVSRADEWDQPDLFAKERERERNSPSKTRSKEWFTRRLCPWYSASQRTWMGVRWCSLSVWLGSAPFFRREKKRIDHDWTSLEDLLRWRIERCPHRLRNKQWSMERLERWVCHFVREGFHSWHSDLEQRTKEMLWLKIFLLVRLILLVPFFSKSRRPLSFSSPFVWVRSVFQMATSNGWCLSLNARSAEAPLLTAECCCCWWLLDVFSSRVSRCESFSRWESFPLRDDLWSTCVLEKWLESSWRNFGQRSNGLTWIWCY